MKIELTIWTVIGGTVEAILLVVLAIAVRMVFLMRRGIAELQEQEKLAARLAREDHEAPRAWRRSGRRPEEEERKQPFRGVLTPPDGAFTRPAAARP